MVRYQKALLTIICLFSVISIVSAASLTSVTTDKAKYNVGDTITFTAVGEGTLQISLDPSFVDIFSQAEGENPVANSTVPNIESLTWYARMQEGEPSVTFFEEGEELDLTFEESGSVEQAIQLIDAYVLEASFDLSGYLKKEDRSVDKSELGGYESPEGIGEVIRGEDVIDHSGLVAYEAGSSDNQYQWDSLNSWIIKEFEGVNYYKEDLQVDLRVWNDNRHGGGQEELAISVSPDNQAWSECFSELVSDEYSGVRDVSAQCESFTGDDLYVKVWMNTGDNYNILDDLNVSIHDREPLDVSVAEKDVELAYQDVEEVYFTDYLKGYECEFVEGYCLVPIDFSTEFESGVGIVYVRNLVVSLAFTGSVEINHAPVLEELADIAVTEGDLVTVSAVASDPDEDELIYRIDNSKFSQEGSTFVWQTVIGDESIYALTVSVTDPDGLEDSQAFALTVNKKQEFSNQPGKGGDDGRRHVGERETYSGPDKSTMSAPSSEQTGVVAEQVKNSALEAVPTITGGAVQYTGGEGLLWEWLLLLNPAALVMRVIVLVLAGFL